MITESELWKDDLVKTAEKLLKRMIQKRWSKRSWFCVEKELFIGFYIVRKLIESGDVPQHLISRSFELSMFPRKAIISNEFDSFVPYDAEEHQKKKVNIRDICNQFIHSYYLSPYGANGVLTGFLINSEFQSRKGIYMISIFDIVEIFRLCADREGLVEQYVK